jgi:TRAP transporter TAXI family solute receptor
MGSVQSPRAVPTYDTRWLTQLGLIILAAATIAAVGISAWIGLAGWRKTTLRIAAGNRHGESHVIMSALAEVLSDLHPQLHVEIVETGGTTESIQQLERGEVDLAAAQVDVPTGPTARMLAVLYHDACQLVVREDADIEHFVDLRGKRIALPQKGGQYQTFLSIAAHYGLDVAELTFVGTIQDEADTAFREGHADAIFCVRALGNPTISDFIKTHRGRLLPIDHGEAMRIQQPAFTPTTIPAGAYRGYPPMPASDLPTVAIARTLLARADVPPNVIQRITQTLDEQRLRLIDRIPQANADARPLIAHIQRPSNVGASNPLHEGARAHFERDQPSFIQANADYIALLLTIALLVGSWLVQLRRWLDRCRKDAADVYIDQAVDLMTANGDDCEQLRMRLAQLFLEATQALVDERISEESFRTFNEAYKAAREVIEHQEQQLHEQRLNARRHAEQEHHATQQRVADRYIKAIVASIHDEHRAPELALAQLEGVLQHAANDLVSLRISQDSFRTIVATLHAAREAIGDRPRSPVNT